MSVFRDTLKFVSMHDVDIIFNTAILIQYIYDRNIKANSFIIDNYLRYLVDAKYIKASYVYNRDWYYVVINEIPEPSTLTIGELKKLGNDNYRINYMRKLKLKQLKCQSLN